MRLVRALRLLNLFSDMWKMCNGLMKAVSTMLSVMVMIAITIYMFACFGVDVISQSSLADNERTTHIVGQHFSSLPTVMLTLMQFANADSIAEIYAPLIHEQPLLALYFGVLWLVLTVSLMNVITAVILESALAKSKDEAQDQLMEKRRMFKRIRPRLEEIFSQLDRDQSGVISMEEVMEAVKSGELSFPEEIGVTVAAEQILDAFDFLDTDMSGELDCKEFVEGVLVLVLSAVPMETAQILHLTRLCFAMLVKTSAAVEKLTERPGRRSVRSQQSSVNLAG
jgi:hypothetical protein